MTNLKARFEKMFGPAFPDEQLKRELVLKFVEAELKHDEENRVVTRHRLSNDHKSITREFVIKCPGHPQGDFMMHATVGLYPDDRPGEIFLWVDKAGSLASGALTAVAISLSFQWQHGVPFEASVAKFKGTRFEPQGATGDARYPMVKSPLDYLARWLLDRFGAKPTGGENS